MDNDITVHMKSGGKLHGSKLVFSRFFPREGWIGLITTIDSRKEEYKRFDIREDDISFVSSPIVDENTG